MGIPDYFACRLSDLYEDQEATVRTEHETMDWFKIKIQQGCILLFCLFNLNTRLDVKYQAR